VASMLLGIDRLHTLLRWFAATCAALLQAEAWFSPPALRFHIKCSRYRDRCAGVRSDDRAQTARGYSCDLVGG
jgi:hypothetical protein